MWWMTEHRDTGECGAKVTWQGWGSSHVSFMVIVNNEQTFNYVFSHISNAKIRKTSALTVLFRPTGKKVVRGRGATMVSRWLFTKIYSEMHWALSFLIILLCDCSSKWKEGAGSSWGAGLFHFLFLGKVSWMFCSAFLWQIEQHRNWVLRLTLS